MIDRDYITVAEYAQVRGISRQTAYKSDKVTIDGVTGQKIVMLSALSDDERAKVDTLFTGKGDTDCKARKGEPDPVDTERDRLTEKINQLTEELLRANEDKQRLFDMVDALTRTVGTLSDQVTNLQTRLLPAPSAPDQDQKKPFPDRLKAFFTRK